MMHCAIAAYIFFPVQVSEVSKSIEVSGLEFSSFGNGNGEMTFDGEEFGEDFDTESIPQLLTLTMKKMKSKC